MGVHIGEIDSIESGWPTNLKWCCNKMLETWLEVDTSASWNKINNAIASPVVSGYQGTGVMEGEYSISLL